MDNLTSLPIKNQVDRNIGDFINKIELPRHPLKLINETAKNQLARFAEIEIFTLNVEQYQSLVRFRTNDARCFWFNGVWMFLDGSSSQRRKPFLIFA
jgi:hypothetical protein